MSKKKLPVTGLVNELHGASVYFRQPAEPTPPIGEAPQTKKLSSENKIQYEKSTQKSTQKDTQTVTHMSSILSNPPTTEAIEQLSFELRKTAKVRVNADIPQEWKDKLDDLAHKLRVGKYEFMLYLIALAIGKVQAKDQD